MKKKFFHIDPRTFKVSERKYSGETALQAVEKIYRKIIAEYIDTHIIIPPTLVVYVKEENKKKIHGFEANIASFNMKSHNINLQLDGHNEILNITKSIPRITKIPITKTIQKQINGTAFTTNVKKDFFANYLPNQTYDMSSIFNNVSTNKYIITISDYSDDSTEKLFQITPNYLCFVDIIGKYISPDWLKTNNFKIQLDNSDKMFSANLIYNNYESHNMVQIEVAMYNIQKIQQTELYEMLINVYDKKYIVEKN